MVRAGGQSLEEGEGVLGGSRGLPSSDRGRWYHKAAVGCEGGGEWVGGGGGSEGWGLCF